jgi:hypothetical protein|tara:strand:+ start:291 stop:536 length:246 start_codon:yes stop_codon:yes gene_type:complete
MYKVGIGYYFNDGEEAVFKVALDQVAELPDVPLTGDKQNIVVDLLKALKPLFSEGELRMAVRRSGVMDTEQGIFESPMKHS